jgi:hypothetical protein
VHEEEEDTAPVRGSRFTKSVDWLLACASEIALNSAKLLNESDASSIVNYMFFQKRCCLRKKYLDAYVRNV